MCVVWCCLSLRAGWQKRNLADPAPVAFNSSDQQTKVFMAWRWILLPPNQAVVKSMRPAPSKKLVAGIVQFLTKQSCFPRPFYSQNKGWEAMACPAVYSQSVQLTVSCGRQIVLPVTMLDSWPHHNLELAFRCRWWELKNSSCRHDCRSPMNQNTQGTEQHIKLATEIYHCAFIEMYCFCPGVQMIGLAGSHSFPPKDYKLKIS